MLIYINLSGSLFFVWCFLDLTMATMFLDVSRQPTILLCIFYVTAFLFL